MPGCRRPTRSSMSRTSARRWPKHDPANAEAYNANAAAYAAKIKALDEPLRKRLSAIPEGQRWLVTSEGAFSYLARDYGLQGALPLADQCRRAGHAQAGAEGDRPRAQEQDPGGVQREHDLATSRRRQVAKETGARYGGVLYVDSLSAANGPVPTYLKLLEVTVRDHRQGVRQVNMTSRAGAAPDRSRLQPGGQHCRCAT